MKQTPEMPGIDPETGNYHAELMPPPQDEALAEIYSLQMAGEPLTIGQQMRAGRDETQQQYAGHDVLPDHVYRAVGEDGLDAYMESGAVTGRGENDEYEPGNNKGVDWYLGGVAAKYGEVVLMAPANADYFTPANDAGFGMAKDPNVRHMKSSGSANPVPMSTVRVLRPQ